ncbi:hypothetical protein PQB76_gp056 [Arthrobacter phage Cheesy]|uniref:Uncharacterized protein n=1 Tax=Arthrobacter phage Cheesy TaxID=2015816 RepID=A0A222ZJP8_9CAUD|nr:hypothetical protein PQB76_gp056 [Arthrobacter phage Cheesy]ASR84635.1 hypothetical protein SEA_CHEESY_56 [Arthrobacter phage Cheesy]
MKLDELGEAQLTVLLKTLHNAAMNRTTTAHEREQAASLAISVQKTLEYNSEIDRKRQAISEHYHNSIAHPAIRQMSPDRVEQTYDRLVEQGKIKEGEN